MAEMSEGTRLRRVIERVTRGRGGGSGGAGPDAAAGSSSKVYYDLQRARKLNNITDVAPSARSSSAPSPSARPTPASQPRASSWPLRDPQTT